MPVLLIMKLDNLTKEQIEQEEIPFEDLLRDSVYYPACNLDGRPIRYCNTIWRKLGVNSFVYCDFDVSEDQFLKEMEHICGYKVLGHRALRQDEYIPEGWKLELVKDNDGEEGSHCYYWDTFLGNPGPGKFAHWVVYERVGYKGYEHGPKRFSLLYIGGEGLATFQQLYCHYRVAPKMICFIQCWGFAGNWTNFTMAGAPFHLTLLKYKECSPEWLCIGHYRSIDGVQKLNRTRKSGIRKVGYRSEKGLERFYGVYLTPIENDMRDRFYSFSRGDKRYVALAVSHNMDLVVYDVTDCQMGMDELHEYLTMREQITCQRIARI